jgi:hypothetical protein
MKDATFELVRLQQHHRALKQQFAAIIQQRDRAIEERAVLRYRRRQILDVLERTPVLSRVRLAQSDSSQLFLQRQLKLMDQKLTKIDQALRLEHLQRRKIVQALWQLSLQVGRLKERQANHRKRDAPTPTPTLSPSRLSPWQVAPTYKQPNPLKDLRQQPQKRFGTVLLPWASLGLLLEIAISIVLDLALLAAMGLILLLGLWLLVAMAEGLRSN